MRLAPAERANLRSAIDAERRRRLGQFAAQPQNQALLCCATAQSGRRCRNQARFGALCGVHARAS